MSRPDHEPVSQGEAPSVIHLLANTFMRLFLPENAAAGYRLEMDYDPDIIQVERGVTTTDYSRMGSSSQVEIKVAAQKAGQTFFRAEEKNIWPRGFHGRKLLLKFQVTQPPESTD